MPAPWPTLPGRRCAWDRTAVGFWLTGAVGATPTDMDEPQRQAMNDESASSPLIVTTAAGIKIWVGVLFDEPMLLEAFFLSSNNTGWEAMETSADTTDGKDGVWVDRVTPLTTGVRSDSAVNPAWRTDQHAMTLPVDGVKGVRFRNAGGATVQILAMHLYSTLSSTAGLNRMVIEDPASNEEADKAMFDFADVPRRSSADIPFRVKNHSPTIVSVGVTLSVEALTLPVSAPSTAGQLLISGDGGMTFAASVNIGTLSPGQASRQLLLRRVTPGDATLGLWTGRLIATGPGLHEATEYFYFGDVSNNSPSPHLWFLTPLSARIGDLIEVVGAGFGSSAAEYTSTLRLGATDMTIGSWTQIAASVDAYGSARTIQALNDAVNVFHQRITFEVPLGAIDDYVTVRTNAP